MIFRPELCAKVLDGSKTVTRRPVSDNPRSPWWRERCAYEIGWEVGDTYAVQPGRGKPAVGRIRITGLPRCEQLVSLDDCDARREGFEDRAGFVAYWTDLHGSYDPEQLVWRLAFRCVEAAG